MALGPIPVPVIWAKCEREGWDYSTSEDVSFIIRWMDREYMQSIREENERQEALRKKK